MTYNEKVLDESTREAGVYGIKLIEEAELVSEEFTGKENSVFSFEISEYMSKCPRSGLPDFASIKIVYIPDQKVVNEISLKRVNNSFINFRGGHETTVNEFFDLLEPLLEPKYIAIFGNFSIRGNVKTIPFSDKYKDTVSKEEREKLKELTAPYLKGLVSDVMDKLDREF